MKNFEKDQPLMLHGTNQWRRDKRMSTGRRCVWSRPRDITFVYGYKRNAWQCAQVRHGLPFWSAQMDRGLWEGVERLHKPPQASNHREERPQGCHTSTFGRCNASINVGSLWGWCQQRRADLEPLHNVSYDCNNIHECVLQGYYEHDNDAVDVQQMGD